LADKIRSTNRSTGFCFAGVAVGMGKAKNQAATRSVSSGLDFLKRLTPIT
jgi:hypothetical protein